MSVQSIRYVGREEIDITKWDNCIDESYNTLIYAYSIYLDNMAKHWDALILGDYEAVMPLTWNRKWGIKYLYQPAFTQQLGIFCRTEISSFMVESFLKKVSTHFRFAEIFLNYKNSHPALKKHSNFILPLNAYENIYAGYSYNVTRSLNRSKTYQFKYTADIQLLKALEAYKNAYRHRMPHLTEKDFNGFEKLCSIAQGNGEALVRAVFAEDGQLLSVAMLLQKRNKIYLLQSTTFPAGRKIEANYFLIDNIIKEFSGKDFILDFEGSDIPGIAHFYRIFGSINQPYFYYRLNILPWWIKWIKNFRL